MIIELDRKSNVPLYMQIKLAIKRMIEQGILPSGHKLPSSRDLAAQLGVNRNTVNNAYEELIADDYLEAHVGQGTFVKKVEAEEGHYLNPFTGEAYQPRYELNWSHLFPQNPRFDQVLHEIHAGETGEGVISFANSIPDSRLFPYEKIRSIMTKLSRQVDASFLDYGPVLGSQALRELLRQRFKFEGIDFNTNDILITSGSQQGVDLAIKTLLKPGDTVAMEIPSYTGAINLFEMHDLNILPIPIDHNGMIVDALEDVLKTNKIKMIYTIPTFQNPTGVTMSSKRREKLLTLAREHQVPVFEDDFSGFLRYEGQPLYSLKALDTGGFVMHSGTFSKALFPGFRVGWLIVPRQALERVAMIKKATDISTNLLGQVVLTNFIEKGWFDKHLAKMRRTYKSRRDTMLSTMEQFFPDQVKWNRPEGGLTLWVQLPKGMRSGHLLMEARRKGVVFTTGSFFTADGRDLNGFRLCFTRLEERKIKKGLKILGALLQLEIKHFRERKPEGELADIISVV